jgi:biopolymer transport protein ExbB
MMSSLQLQLPEWFVAGGVAMWLLAVLSVVAFATLLTKMFQFARLWPVASK